jgi:hypothetical protein
MNARVSSQVSGGRYEAAVKMIDKVIDPAAARS